MRDFSHQKSVYSTSFSVFGGFLQLATVKTAGRILTQNTPEHVFPRKYVPYDKNCKFRKSRMAEGRHFENG